MRQKIVFKKLLFFNSKRMLDILKFKPGDAERKKLKSVMQTNEVRAEDQVDIKIGNREETVAISMELQSLMSELMYLQRTA